MMALKLEVFADDAFSAPVPEAAPEMFESALVEEMRLAAFDAGYRAGWDDAIAAAAGEEAALNDQVGRNIQGLAFTYHEARSHVLRALSPLIADIAVRLLPEIAHAALPQLVAEALGPYAELAADAPVEVMVHPDARARVETLLGTSPDLPLTVRDDAGLAPGQVWLRLGETETRIDIDAALGSIRTVLQDFFDPAAKERRHG